MKKGQVIAMIAMGVMLGVMPASAQAPEVFYPGKTLNMIIGYGPGGGYDGYGRLLARHMGRFLPGQPTIVPQNMPGAGSIKAINYLYTVAPKDGTVMGIFATAALLEPLYGRAGASFDPAKFTWIGNMDESIGTCAVWHTSGIKTFEDLREKETLFGGSGPAALNSQHAAALKNLLGLKLKIIQGYPGALETRMAMPKGELQGGCGFALSSLQSQHGSEYRSGELKPIVQLAIEKSAELPGVAHIYDYAKDAEMRQVFDLIFGSHVLGRPVLGPPGIPDDRKQALRTAFSETVADATFLAEARKSRMPIKATNGAGVEKLFDQFLSAPKNVVDRAAAAIRD